MLSGLEAGRAANTHRVSRSVQAMSALEPERALQSCTLLAVDGQTGALEQFYFDDQSWAVRYLVVNSGCWLTGRRVLISPVAVGDLEQGDRQLHIELTREQIRNSPPIDVRKPVSRKYEEQYFSYYGWPPYWSTGPVPGLPPPRRAMAPASETGYTATPEPERTHLRSTAEVRGYAIAAQDGAIGHVEDFIVDVRYWVIRYLEIATRNWWPGRHVLISPEWIERIGWAERTVQVELTRDAMERAPVFDRQAVISRDYEAELFRHYGRRGYWQQGNQAIRAP